MVIQETIFPLPEEVFMSMELLYPLGIGEKPGKYSPPFLQIYPIPSSAQIAILYTLSERAPIELEILDISGRLVKRLVKGIKTPGRRSICWDGRDEEGRKVPNGVYFCKLRVDDTYHDIVKLVEIR